MNKSDCEACAYASHGKGGTYYKCYGEKGCLGVPQGVPFTKPTPYIDAVAEQDREIGVEQTRQANAAMLADGASTPFDIDAEIDPEGYTVGSAMPPLRVPAKNEQAGRLRCGHPEFYRLLGRMEAIHDAKNHDYSKQGDPLSNFKRAAAFGIEPWRGALVRLSDKWCRIEQLAGGKEPAVKDEALEDTLLDLANYALLTIILRRESIEQGHGISPVPVKEAA